jgi:hypothetical protein
MRIPALPSLASAKRCLLVLDLNGTLLHRRRTNSGANTHIYVRPYLGAFLCYISHPAATLDVAVWSSARRANVELMVERAWTGASAGKPGSGSAEGLGGIHLPNLVFAREDMLLTDRQFSAYSMLTTTAWADWTRACVSPWYISSRSQCTHYKRSASALAAPCPASGRTSPYMGAAGTISTDSVSLCRFFKFSRSLARNARSPSPWPARYNSPRRLCTQGSLTAKQPPVYSYLWCCRTVRRCRRAHCPYSYDDRPNCGTAGRRSTHRCGWDPFRNSQRPRRRVEPHRTNMERPWCATRSA